MFNNLLIFTPISISILFLFRIMPLVNWWCGMSLYNHLSSTLPCYMSIPLIWPIIANLSNIHTGQLLFSPLQVWTILISLISSCPQSRPISPYPYIFVINCVCFRCIHLSILIHAKFHLLNVIFINLSTLCSIL